MGVAGGVDRPSTHFWRDRENGPGSGFGLDLGRDVERPSEKVKNPPLWGAQKPATAALEATVACQPGRRFATKPRAKLSLHDLRVVAQTLPELCQSPWEYLGFWR